MLVQYTALAWSAHGFPHRFFHVLKILRTAGARVAVVFHDAEPYHGRRLVGRFRRLVQICTMRWAVNFADFAIFTVPLEKLSWKPTSGPNREFVPVGPNLPVPEELPVRSHSTSIPRIGVFSITGGEAGARETQLILSAVRQAVQQVGRIRLSVFGRYAELREEDLVNVAWIAGGNLRRGRYRFCAGGRTPVRL